jgi:hypothetical protein
MGMSGQRQAPASLYPLGKDAGSHWTGDWMGPRACLETEARGKILTPLPGIEHGSPCSPVRGQTLFCLSYAGSSSKREIAVK